MSDPGKAWQDKTVFPDAVSMHYNRAFRVSWSSTSGWSQVNGLIPIVSDLPWQAPCQGYAAKVRLEPWVAPSGTLDQESNRNVARFGH